jgi:hypothetical protein
MRSGARPPRTASNTRSDQLFKEDAGRAFARAAKLAHDEFDALHSGAGHVGFV